MVGLALAGCGRKEQGLVLVTPSITAPPILRSEAAQIAIPVRVAVPIRFENRSSVTQSVTISKTGCSCYGMATAESFLKPGEQIDVTTGSAKELFFVAKELKAEAEQAFRVGFHVGATSDASAGEELRADCSMKILPDLVLEPASIVINLASKETADPQSNAVTLTRVTRGKPAESTPAFSMSPPLLKLESVRQEKTPEEIFPNLWRTVWTCSLKPEQLPAEIRDNGGRFTFAFEFPEAHATTPIQTESAHGDGQIPTILDIVSSDPDRTVSGQLILRRSKGIIAPSQLHFGAIPAGSGPRTRRLVLTAADHRPFQVTIGEVPSQFSVVADSDEPGEQLWVTVTFKAGSAGDSEGKLTLKTTHPDQPEVQVTLKARVQ